MATHGTLRLSHSTTAAQSLAGNQWGKISDLLRAWALHTGLFFFHRVFQTLPKQSITCFQPMAHFQANLRKLSHFAVEMVSFIQRTSLSSLSSSFHPCSAYPLSSNLVLLCRWWAGAIIGSLRLTLEKNVRQFKAACQSAFCVDSPPELPRLFSAYITNWGAQRQKQEKRAPLIYGLPCHSCSFSGSCTM